jgi:hypothetical protein
MADSGEATAPKAERLSLEDLAKAAAGVGAASLMVGIVYNIAFFAPDRFHWLFAVSASDNWTATMYALPFTALAAAAFGLALWVLFQQASNASIGWVWRFYLIASGVVVVVIGIWWSISRPVPFGYFAFSVLSAAAWIFFLLLTVTVLHRLRSGSQSRPVLIALLGIFAAVSLLTTPSVVAVNAQFNVEHQPTQVEVEVPLRGVFSGNLVRILDGGVILAQGNDWVWIPKGEVRQIKERHEKKP